jgi:hypothetical protein
VDNPKRTLIGQRSVTRSTKERDDSSYVFGVKWFISIKICQRIVSDSKLLQAREIAQQIARKKVYARRQSLKIITNGRLFILAVTIREVGITDLLFLRFGIESIVIHQCHECNVS